MHRLILSLPLAAGLLLAGEAAAQTAAPKKAPPPPPSAQDVINSVEANADVEAQAAGHYPAMTRGESLPLGQIQRAWDQAGEEAGVQTFRYSPDRVMRVRAREFMTTTIVLPSWETVDHVDVADDFVFEVAQPKPNILKVRPKHVGADSTVTLFGESGNVYAFYVRSEGHNSANVSDVIVRIRADAPFARSGEPNLIHASVSAPGRPQASPGAAARPVKASREVTGEMDPDFLQAIPFDAQKLRFDFSMSGDRSIAPDRVFTDGIFTYFDYGRRWDTSDLPTVYRVVDGVDTPINTRIKGSMLVAEASGAFTLRNGQRYVCVRPEGFAPDSDPPRQPAPKEGFSLRRLATAARSEDPSE